MGDTRQRGALQSGAQFQSRRFAGLSPSNDLGDHRIIKGRDGVATLYP